jgi:pimeloyl-ACP methyl ester carboxylesterase
MRLHVHQWGSGPPVVLVHGGILGGRETWRGQRPLTERWTLLAPDRLGHGRSPDGLQDFDRDAELVADQLLDPPAHLVGFSYGGIVAMLAAAARPEGVRTLTIVEPPATRVAQGTPAVDAWDAELRKFIAGHSKEDLRAWLADFFAVIGVAVEIPDPVPEPLVRGARALIGGRPPGDARVPLDILAEAPFPILVVSGGHLEACEIICDVIAAETAADRAVITGNGHLIPDTGAPFNDRLEAFWAA